MFLSISITAWRQGKGVFALRGALALHTEYPAFKRVLVQDCPHSLGVLEIDAPSHTVTWTPERHADGTAQHQASPAVKVPLPPRVGRMRQADQLYSLMHVAALRHAVRGEVCELPEVRGSGLPVPARDPDTVFGGGRGNAVITIGWRVPVKGAEVRFVLPDGAPGSSDPERIGTSLVLMIDGFLPVILDVGGAFDSAVEKVPGVIGLPSGVETWSASTEFPTVGGASGFDCTSFFSCAYAVRCGSPWDEVRRGLAEALAHEVACGLEGSEVSVAVTRPDGGVIARVTPDNANLWKEK